MQKGHRACRLSAALLLLGIGFSVPGYAQNGDCLKYEAERVSFTGSVYAVGLRRAKKPIRYWVLRLPEPVCVDGGKAKSDVAEAGVQELQLAFAEGSPYYSIYKTLVDGRSSFRVTGTLFHSRSARPIRKVAIRVEDFVPRSAP
jgi:hypothetical protein